MATETTITLRKAVDLSSMTYGELQLAEPTADQWSQWDGLAGAEADIHAVSIVAGVPLPAVRKIGTSDLLKASRFIAAFLDWQGSFGEVTPDEWIVELRKPIVHGDTTITELRLHEPTADEWTKWDRLTGLEAEIVKVATVAGVPVAAVRKVFASQLMEASRYISLFLA